MAAGSGQGRQTAVIVPKSAAALARAGARSQPVQDRHLVDQFALQRIETRRGLLQAHQLAERVVHPLRSPHRASIAASAQNGTQASE
jgi:hypothetical protein